MKQHQTFPRAWRPAPTLRLRMRLDRAYRAALFERVKGQLRLLDLPELIPVRMTAHGNLLPTEGSFLCQPFNLTAS